ncbi:MAG: Xaa-Pro peptidase family protein [Syntrophobacteraceae bacterium]|nr:Xaa-Pro peptidase family protein [Syntrophobacteraceae bacterium]
MEKAPAGEIANRISMLQELLRDIGVDAALIRQNADLFYFTGTVQDAHLIVPSSGAPVLLVRRSIERTEDSSPIRPVVPLTSLGDLARAVFDACGPREPQIIGLELDVMPVNTFLLYSKRIFSKQQIVDISGLVRRVRMIKSAWEIEMLKNAASISKLIAESVPALLKPGMSEFDLCSELECVSRKAGNYGMLRCRTFNMEMIFAHVLSGLNGAVPSYTDAPSGGPGISPAFGQGSDHKKILPGEIVSVDATVVWNGYANDQTRNFCIGPPPARLLEAYEFVRSTHARLRGIARPGAVTGDLHEMVWQWAKEAGWAKWFMGCAEPRITFVGHGIGVEVDELPFIARRQELELQEGMVFAFEPKVVIPGEGIAGLENTYLVTGSGITSLNEATEDLVII